MAKNWEDDEFIRADLLGFGCFQFVHGGSGKSRSKTQIGFVRQDVTNKSQDRSGAKNVRGKGGVSNKGRSQTSKASSKQTKR